MSLCIGVYDKSINQSCSYLQLSIYTDAHRGVLHSDGISSSAWSIPNAAYIDCSLVRWTRSRAGPRVITARSYGTQLQGAAMHGGLAPMDDELPRPVMQRPWAGLMSPSSSYHYRTAACYCNCLIELMQPVWPSWIIPSCIRGIMQFCHFKVASLYARFLNIVLFRAMRVKYSGISCPPYNTCGHWCEFRFHFISVIWRTSHCHGCAQSSANVHLATPVLLRGTTCLKICAPSQTQRSSDSSWRLTFLLEFLMFSDFRPSVFNVLSDLCNAPMFRL